VNRDDKDREIERLRRELDEAHFLNMNTLRIIDNMRAELDARAGGDEGWAQIMGNYTDRLSDERRSAMAGNVVDYVNGLLGIGGAK
jgi:hypothetical protein